MKKWLTILLLLILAGQTPVLFHAKADETVFILEAEEKKEKTAEEKSEKQFFSHTSFHKENLPVKLSYDLHCSDLFLSHVSDQPSPPPDVI